jgi:hypothetical protein
LLMGPEDQSTFGFMTDCAMVECMSHFNGYQNDGREVMPIAGDPEGGGNAGGFWTTKYFADNAYNFPQYGTRNWGLNLYFVRCVSWNNCDDGFAFDHAQSVIEDNRSLFNGPTGAMGYKMLRFLQGMSFRGNMAYGNMDRGFELRVDTNTTLQVYNNSSFKNAQHGIWISGGDATTVLAVTNNVSAFNVGPDFSYVGQPSNWAGDGNNVLPGLSGDPKLLNTNWVFSAAFQTNWTVRMKRDFMESEFRQHLSPALGSPLLGTSTLVQGYHCPRADNDPNFQMPLGAPGRHWRIPAPNMGAFDFLTTGGGAKPAAPTNLGSPTNRP